MRNGNKCVRGASVFICWSGCWRPWDCAQTAASDNKSTPAFINNGRESRRRAASKDERRRASLGAALLNCSRRRRKGRALGDSFIMRATGCAISKYIARVNCTLMRLSSIEPILRDRFYHFYESTVIFPSLKAFFRVLWALEHQVLKVVPIYMKLCHKS